MNVAEMTDTGRAMEEEPFFKKSTLASDTQFLGNASMLLLILNF